MFKHVTLSLSLLFCSYISNLSTSNQPIEDTMSASPTPTLFLSHGPGPMWLLDKGDLARPEFSNIHKGCRSAQSLRDLIKNNSLPSVRALVVVSAHHIEREHTVMVGEKPELYFDYYRFPEKAYKVCMWKLGWVFRLLSCFCFDMCVCVKMCVCVCVSCGCVCVFEYICCVASYMCLLVCL